MNIATHVPMKAEASGRFVCVLYCCPPLFFEVAGGETETDQDLELTNHLQGLGSPVSWGHPALRLLAGAIA